MDFRQTTQPNSGRPAVATPALSGPDHKEEKEFREVKTKSRNWLQMFNGIMLVGTALLVACVAVALTRSSGNSEHAYVDSSKYQAVFLTNGQVYFGNIDNLNNNYLRMTNIYYLTQGSDSKTSSYSLVKLGCQQIHDPIDEMVVNRSQVTFWENLQNDGKVVSSIKQFQKQNPKGPDCSQVSNQTQASSSSTQGSTTTNTGTDNSSTTK